MGDNSGRIIYDIAHANLSSNTYSNQCVFFVDGLLSAQLSFYILFIDRDQRLFY